MILLEQAENRASLVSLARIDLPRCPCFPLVLSVGWPLSTATSERGTFAEKILDAKQKAFVSLIAKDKIPLRIGAQKVGRHPPSGC